MKIMFYYKQGELTPEIKDYAEKKIKAATKYFANIIEARLELDENTKVASGDKYRAEIHLKVPNGLIYADTRGETLKAAIDLVLPKAERQLKDYKEKLQDNKRKGK